MEKTSKSLFSAIAATVTIAVTGCASTDVIGPPADFEEVGEKITLSIDCPEAAAATRAGNDHVLRYSAIMYAGDNIDGVEVAERKEVIASDEGETIITFDVPQGTYSFVVIGDYIPMKSVEGVLTNPEPDDNGFFQDVYYDTHANDTRIWAIPHQNKKAPDADFFNNDNYDCFAAKTEITKRESAVDENVRLTRIVSRISFVSTTPLPAEIENITITDFDYFPYYNFLIKSTGSQHANCNQYNMAKRTISSVYTEGSAELFYFYTLASKTASEGLYPMSITVNFKDNSSRTLTTPDDKIQPQANYKIKVSGPFLSEPPVEKGPINLHVTTSEDWGDDIDIKVK